MEKRRILMLYVWVLTLLTLPISILPNRIFTGLLVIWFGYHGLRSGKFDIKAVKVLLFAVALLLLSFVSNPVLSKELLLGLTLAAQGFFLICIRPDRKVFTEAYHLATLTGILVLLGAASAKIVLLGPRAYFQQEQWWNLWHYNHLTGALSLHPTYFSLFLLAGLCLLLFGNGSPSIKNTVTSKGLAVLTLYLLTLWLVAAKMALIAMLGLLLIFWIQRLSSSSKNQAIVYSLVLGLVVVPPALSPSVQHRFGEAMKSMMEPLPTELPSRVSERRALWKSAALEIDQHPVVGTSFRGQEAREVIFPRAKFYYKPLALPMNAHNNYLEMSLRYGILFGAVLLLSSIFGLLRSLRKRSLEHFGLCWIFFAMSMTESFLFREQGLALFGLLFFYALLTEDE